MSARKSEYSVIVTIENATDEALVYKSNWMDVGEHDADNKFEGITGHGGFTIAFLQSLITLGRVSGYMVYNMGGEDVTFAFSTPKIGKNKAGFGKGSNDGSSNSVWDNMEGHYETPGHTNFDIGSKKYVAHFTSTDEKLNLARFRIEYRN